VDKTVELALVLTEPVGHSLVLEQPSQAKFEFSVDRAYGTLAIDELRTALTTALAAPTVVRKEATPREWVVNNCTMTVYHPIETVQFDELHLMVQLPLPANEVIARLVNVSGGETEMEATEPGWKVHVDGLTVRISEIETIDYDTLYAYDALEDSYGWVAAIGKETMGFGNSVYGSAPVIHPGQGGFLEVFGGVVLQVKSWRAFVQALPGRQRAGLFSWWIARSAHYTGWVAVPRAYAGKPHGELLRYLHSPASLNAGWVHMHQRYFADKDQLSGVPFLHDPDINYSRIDSFLATVDGILVQADVFEATAPGVDMWFWMRLTVHKEFHRQPRH
jgi:hypothetical protein